MANADKPVLVIGATGRQRVTVSRFLHRDDSLGAESKQWQSQ